MKSCGLRANARKQFNVAKRTEQWDSYKETLTCYNKEIRKAKRSHGGATAGRSMMYRVVPDS
jgi:hypothetical protein